MILGRVNAAHDPVIRVIVFDSQDKPHEFSAIVDTGFNGWLTLPSLSIESMGLSWLRLGRASLADGSETLFDVYEAHVHWDGEQRAIPVDQSDSEPLVGMRLMERFELRIEAVIGGAVELVRMQ